MLDVREKEQFVSRSAGESLRHRRAQVVERIQDLVLTSIKPAASRAAGSVLR
jgi:hypothetical protein